MRPRKKSEITVKDLIETLKEFDPNDEVRIVYKSADYWKTLLVASIKDVECLEYEYSDYHLMDKVTSRDSDEEGKPFVAIVIDNTF